MSVSKKVRFEIFKRDKFTCQYCGKRPPDVLLEVDHIHPRCEGGTDDPANLTTACFACNRGKSGKPLGDVAPAIDEIELLSGIQEMLERSQGLKQSMAVAEAQRAAEEDVIDAFCSWYTDAFGDASYVEPNSIRRFLKSLTPSDLGDAIVSTEGAAKRRGYMNRPNTWKYFCGVCWSMIRDRKDVDG